MNPYQVIFIIILCYLNCHCFFSFSCAIFILKIRPMPILVVNLDGIPRPATARPQAHTDEGARGPSFSRLLSSRLEIGVVGEEDVVERRQVPERSTPAGSIETINPW